MEAAVFPDLSDYTLTSALAEAGTLLARWYTEPTFLALETEKIFAKTWQPVGRAGPVASGKGNRKSLQCRYPGWTYGLDGRLRHAPEFDGVANWRKEDVCLTAVRVAERCSRKTL